MRTGSTLPKTSDLQDSDPQTIANQCNVPVVWADHQVTRRQRIHGLSLPNSSEAFTSTHLNEIIDHLDQCGFNGAIFITLTPRKTHLACWIEFQPLEQ